MTYADKIVGIAQGYVGQQEIQPNAGFKDPSFEFKMRARGWRPPQPWCAYFAKECWVEAYADDLALQGKVKTTLDGSALISFSQGLGSGVFVISPIPVPGAIVVFRQGLTPEGHEGIVTKVQGNIILTIEGNTNTDGSRDGYEVAAKTHDITRPFVAGALNIVGYIHPVEN